MTEDEFVADMQAALERALLNPDYPVIKTTEEADALADRGMQKLWGLLLSGGNVGDKEMADSVCSSIYRGSTKSEWGALKAQQDWVYALLAERDALRVRVHELEERVIQSAALVSKAVALMSPPKG
jgi:hypothetical protein